MSKLYLCDYCGITRKRICCGPLPCLPYDTPAPASDVPEGQPIETAPNDGGMAPAVSQNVSNVIDDRNRAASVRDKSAAASGAATMAVPVVAYTTFGDVHWISRNARESTPFGAKLVLASDYAALRAQLAERDEQLAEALVEQAWRRRSMVPICPHCHAGILPTDGFGKTLMSRSIEARRREVAKAQADTAMAEQKQQGAEG